MKPREAFEMIEAQLLDCTYSRARVLNSDNFEEYQIVEVYEANRELIITIQEKENNENSK